MGLTTTATVAGVTTTALTTGGAAVAGLVQGTLMAGASLAAGGAAQNLHRNPLSGALRAVGSRDGVRSIATSAATMGLTRGLGAALGTPGSAVEASTRARASALAAANPSLSSVPSSIGSSAGAAALRTPTFMQSLSASAAQQAQFHAVNAGARVVTGVAFGGRLDQVAREAAVSAAVDFTGAVAANQAAFVADTQSLGRVGQTALQAGAGAGVGALMGGRDGAIAGGTAAAGATILATAVSPDAATPDELQTAANIGHIGAAFTAMMLRHDIGIATAAAANAMDGFMVSRLTASAPAAGTASPIVEEVEEVPAARPAPSRVVDEEVEEVPATRAELEDRRERRGEERRGRSQVWADHALTLAALDRASAEVDAARSFVHRASDEAPQPTARDRHVAHGLALAKSQRKQSLSPDTRRTVAEVYGEQYDRWFQEAGERRGQLMGLSMMATTMATGGAGLAAGAVVAGGFGGVMALDEQASREHLFGDGGSGPSVVRSMVTEAATVYVGGKVVGAVVSRAAPVVQRMAGRVARIGTGQVVPPTAVMQQSAPLGGASGAPRPPLAERLSAAIERGATAAPPAPRPVPAAAGPAQPQRHVMFEGEGTGGGTAPTPGPRSVVPPTATPPAAAPTQAPRPVVTRPAPGAPAPQPAPTQPIGSQRLLWSSWGSYEKTIIDGREYAKIGDRLYTSHAIARTQPSSLGAPAGHIGAGKSISPHMVEDIIKQNKIRIERTPQGVERTIFLGGDIEVVTEQMGHIIVTIKRVN